MSLAYRVIGIDPALTNVGLCVLESSDVSDYRVTAAETIKPRSSWPMLHRLNAIRKGLYLFFACHSMGTHTVIVEDPTRQRGTRTKRNNPSTIAVMGLAVGVVLDNAIDWSHLAGGREVAFIEVEEWMPRQAMTKGKLSYIMPKPLLVRYLLSRIKMPKGADEHQIMAAGVARYWIEQERLRARLSA